MTRAEQLSSVYRLEQSEQDSAGFRLSAVQKMNQVVIVE